MPADEGDLVDEYRAYLERFDAAAGPSDFGAFVKHNGRLIKKLRYDEFEPVYKEFFEVEAAYRRSMTRGDTINDIVVRLVRDKATELLKPDPI